MAEIVDIKTRAELEEQDWTFEGEYTPDQPGGPETDPIAIPRIEAIEAKIPVDASAENQLVTADSVSTSFEAVDAQITGVSDRVTNVETVVPTTAAPTNKLVDRDTMNSTITSLAANYVTYDALGNAFPDDDALANATVFYHGNQEYVPSDKDYVTILSSASAPAPYTGGTVRKTLAAGVWAYSYGINESPLTADQLAAVNSGVTAQLITSLQVALNAGIVSTSQLNDALGTNLQQAKSYTDSSLANAVMYDASNNIATRELGAYVFPNGVFGMGVDVTDRDIYLGDATAGLKMWGRNLRPSYNSAEVAMLSDVGSSGGSSGNPVGVKITGPTVITSALTLYEDESIRIYADTSCNIVALNLSSGTMYFSVVRIGFDNLNLNVVEAVDGVNIQSSGIAPGLTYTINDNLAGTSAGVPVKGVSYNSVLVRDVSKQETFSLSIGVSRKRLQESTAIFNTYVVAKVERWNP